MALNTTLYRVLSPEREVTDIDVSFQLNGASDPPTTGGTAVSGTRTDLVAVAHSATGTHTITLDSPVFEVIRVDASVQPQSTSARNLKASWETSAGPNGFLSCTIVTVSGTTAVDATDARVFCTLRVSTKESNP